MTHSKTLITVLFLSILQNRWSEIFAQKIETIPAGRDQIVRVETALNHLTVIELSEPIVMVAAGSPAFKIERRENKVFVQPLEEGASTNLFIWTAAHRYSYELAPAENLTATHFAIDHPGPTSTAHEEKANADTDPTK